MGLSSFLDSVGLPGFTFRSYSSYPEDFPPMPDGRRPFVGHLYEGSRGPIHFFYRLQQEFDECAGLQLGPVPATVVFDSDLIGEILNDSDRFVKSTIEKQLRYFLGDGMLINSGPVWEATKRRIASYFSPGAVSDWKDEVRVAADELIDEWSGRTRSVQPMLQRTTLRILGRTIFGIDFTDEQAAEINDVLGAINDALHQFNAPGISNPLFIAWPQLSPSARSVRTTLRSHSRRILNHGSGPIPQALLDGVGDDYSRNDALNEISTLLLAGHETTGLLITWATYHLATHPDRQQSLRSTMGDESDHPAMKRFVKETLRAYPPTWTIVREARRDCRLGEYTLPEGTHLYIPQLVLHRSSRFFDHPHAFRPERWEEGRDRPQHAFLPFGGGPRVCPGGHFAKQEARVILHALLRNGSIELTEPIQPDFKPGITLQPDREIPLRFCPEV